MGAESEPKAGLPDVDEGVMRLRLRLHMAESRVSRLETALLGIQQSLDISIANAGLQRALFARPESSEKTIN